MRKRRFKCRDIYIMDKDVRDTRRPVRDEENNGF